MSEMARRNTLELPDHFLADALGAASSEGTDSLSTHMAASENLRHLRRASSGPYSIHQPSPNAPRKAPHSPYAHQHADLQQVIRGTGNLSPRLARMTSGDNTMQLPQNPLPLPVSPTPAHAVSSAPLQPWSPSLAPAYPTISIDPGNSSGQMNPRSPHYRPQQRSALDLHSGVGGLDIDISGDIRARSRSMPDPGSVLEAQRHMSQKANESAHQQSKKKDMGGGAQELRRFSDKIAEQKRRQAEQEKLFAEITGQTLSTAETDEMQDEPAHQSQSQQAVRTQSYTQSPSPVMARNRVDHMNATNRTADRLESPSVNRVHDGMMGGQSNSPILSPQHPRGRRVMTPLAQHMDTSQGMVGDEDALYGVIDRLGTAYQSYHPDLASSLGSGISGNVSLSMGQVSLEGLDFGIGFGSLPPSQNTALNTLDLSMFGSVSGPTDLSGPMLSAPNANLPPSHLSPSIPPSSSPNLSGHFSGQNMNLLDLDAMGMGVTSQQALWTQQSQAGPAHPPAMRAHSQPPPRINDPMLLTAQNNSGRVTDKQIPESLSLAQIEALLADPAFAAGLESLKLEELTR